MKTPTLLLATLSLVALPLAAATPPPCCPPPEPTNTPACCVAVPSAAPLSARSLYQLDATFTKDDGAATTLAALRGRPVVLAMFFASCEYACPVLVHDMQRLRALLPETIPERVQLVLVSFDVERDTPAALRQFRARVSLDAGWTLLRGGSPAVQELAMLLGVKFKRDARGQFAHSNLFTVLNADGEIVHQHAGLNGDVSTAAKAVAALAK
jgi:protein SCO1